MIKYKGYIITGVYKFHEMHLKRNDSDFGDGEYVSAEPINHYYEEPYWYEIKEDKEFPVVDLEDAKFLGDETNMFKTMQDAINEIDANSDLPEQELEEVEINE